MNTTTTQTQATYQVPATKLNNLQHQIDQLNKRAKRLGLAQIQTSVNPDPSKVVHEFAFTETPSNRHLTDNLGHKPYKYQTALPGQQVETPSGYHPTGHVLPYHTVTVQGEKPQIDGWEFVAVLEPVQLDNGQWENFVRMVPGYPGIPQDLRHRLGDCDHCHTKRNRKETFVLRSTQPNEDHHTDSTRQFKVVGRNCLKDFTGGHHDPHALAQAAELLFALNDACQQASDDDDCWGSGEARQDKTFDLQQVLEWTSRMIQVFGWVSRSKANESYLSGLVATADHVIGVLVRPREGIQAWEDFRTKNQPISQDKSRAEAAIAWAQDQTDSDNDYLRNVNLVARMGYTTSGTFGVAVSILAAYDRATEAQQAQERARQSQYQGEIGKRQVFNLTVVSIFGAEGQYGTTGIHRMLDANGNIFTWFASPGTSWLERGKELTLKATVKAHAEYKGAKQTILTRVTEQTEKATK